MSLPATLLFVLLAATGTKADDCSFNLDCGRVIESLSTVCHTFPEHPANRWPRDTLYVGTDDKTSTNSTATLLPVNGAHEITAEDPILPPTSAVTVFKIDKVGGRFRRSNYQSPHHECCLTKSCTLHEVAGYCQTFQPSYQFLANGSPCA